MAGSRRKASDIRRSLAENRDRLETMLDELEERADRLNPRTLASRHPVLVSALGAAVGLVVLRRPAAVASSLKRLAQLGAPFVLRALLKKYGENGDERDADETEERDRQS